MVTNNVTVYQFEVGLDEVFADKVRFRVNNYTVNINTKSPPVIVVIKGTRTSSFSLSVAVDVVRELV